MISAFLVILSAKKRWHYIVAGTLTGLAILTHFGGALTAIIIFLYLIYRDRLTVKLFKNLVIFSIPILLCLLWWAWIINFDFQSLLTALGEQRVRKNAPSFLLKLFDPAYFWQTLLGNTVFFLSVTFSIYLWVKKQIKHRILLIIFLIVTWAYILITGGDGTYPLPFFFIAFVIVLRETYKMKNATSFIVILFITLILGGNYVIETSKRLMHRPSYELFVQEIAKNIPDGSHVFLSSLPTAYFELSKNETLTLMNYVESAGYPERYQRALDRMDYAVMQYDHSIEIYGPLVTRYIQANGESVIFIQVEEKGYATYIVKFKPLKERISIL